MATSFKDLNIWKKGFDLLMRIYEIVKNYPSEEKYILIDQTVRSANSVIANIAESHGRFYFADKNRVLYQARGEVEETRSHLMVAYGRKYISQKDYFELDSEYEGLFKGISSYIESLKIKKRNCS